MGSTVSEKRCHPLMRQSPSVRSMLRVCFLRAKPQAAWLQLEDVREGFVSARKQQLGKHAVLQGMLGAPLPPLSRRCHCYSRRNPPQASLWMLLMLSDETQVSPTHPGPTVDGRNPAPPKKSWNDDSLVHTNKKLFPLVSKWCRISSIHSIAHI